MIASFRNTAVIAAASPTKSRRSVGDLQLRKLVIEQLKALWSPEQIAGRLLADGVSAVRVCTETIYRFIYGKEDYVLELYRHLPEGHRKRRPRRSRKPRDGSIPLDCRISHALISLPIARSSATGRAIC
ncbi:IS30 family transposase [Pseudorhizobium halotolerans]|uniref:IS30 family transposase n=1 Tax=Pseudorhizobium halotolerans TaxID=1233081 RepID=A0ABM8PF01_9HYPH|nr:IS30 family transposase [Pseudorhizobium halotolerans]